jgi:hypothetical protein
LADANAIPDAKPKSKPILKLNLNQNPDLPASFANAKEVPGVAQVPPPEDWQPFGGGGDGWEGGGGGGGEGGVGWRPLWERSPGGSPLGGVLGGGSDVAAVANEDGGLGHVFGGAGVGGGEEKRVQETGAGKRVAGKRVDASQVIYDI